MDCTEALQLARQLMNHHGLPHWTVKLDNALRRFGSCRCGQRTITLSRPLVELNDRPDVLETILHEIAHALAGSRAGHGPHWKRMAKRVGCAPERCFSSEDTLTPLPKYFLRCNFCGRTSARYRKPSRKMACSRCCAKYAFGQYDERFALICEPADGVTA